jgi:hypothetical protein
LAESNPNIQSKRKHNRKKKKFLSNDMSKMYNFDPISNKKINSQKKLIQEAIPYVLSKEDLLKIKKFQNRETKSNVKDHPPRSRARPSSKNQSIYSGKSVALLQNEVTMQHSNMNKPAQQNNPVYLLKNPGNNPSFISVQPNIYGNSHQLVQRSQGETFLVPMTNVKLGQESRIFRNSNTSHYSKSRYSSEKRSCMKNVVSQQGSLTNFTVLGSSHNLDQSQFQAPSNFQRNSNQSGSMGDQLRTDFLLSRTTSIKGMDLENTDKNLVKQSASNFWFYNVHQTNSQMKQQAFPQGTQENLGQQEYPPSCVYLNNVRQSVNLQESTKPQFLIYSHNPSVTLGEKPGPISVFNQKPPSEKSNQFSGKSLSKSIKRKRVRKVSNVEDYHSRSSQYHQQNVNEKKSEESSKRRNKGFEKKLEDMTVEDLKTIFEVLDVKKQGFISKDNFKFTDLPLKTINAMEPFIKEMLVRDGTVDFNQYIDLIQNMMQKVD